MPVTHQVGTVGNTMVGWRPLWMRRSILSVFLLCFMALLVSLEVLDILSLRHNGLATSDMSYHYLWTYGPTAILTLILALWNRVDYRIRQMTPWIVLHKEPWVPASRNMFLDYVSPTAPEILWYSLRNGDFVVTAGTLVANLVTALIVVSTSLMSLVPRPITLTNIPYQTTQSFINDDTNVIRSQSLLPGILIDAIDTLNLSYPLGVTSQHAYQPFDLGAIDLPTDSILQATVEVMSFDLICEEARLDFGFLSYSWMWSEWCRNNDSTSNEPGLHSSINATVGNCTFEADLYGYEYGNDGYIGNFAAFHSDQCTGGVLDDSDVRMLFMFGEARQNGEAGPHPSDNGCKNSSPVAEIEILRSKQWICRPDLSTVPGSVSLNFSDLLNGHVPEISLNETAERRHFDNISYFYLTGAIMYTSTADFSDESTLKMGGLSTRSGPETRVLRSIGPDRLEDLLTTDLYLDLSTKYYKQALSIITHLQLTRGDNTTIEGTATAFRQRLVLRQAPLRTMQAILGVTIVLIVYLIIRLPQHAVVPWDPAQLAGLARILAQNPQLACSFAGTGSLPLSALQQLHSSSKYKSSFLQVPTLDSTGTDCHQFVLEGTTLPAQAQELSNNHINKWWNPFTIAMFSKIAAICAMLIMIVALQILLMFSNRNQGLAAALPSGSENLAWSIAPAIIMAITAMYFRALSTTYKSFAPYYLLRWGSDAMRTVSRNYLSMTEVEVLFHTLRDRQTAVFFATFATILSTFLTIAVSGVFTVLPVPLTFDTTIRQQSWFLDTGSDDNGTLGNSGPISGLILMSNLSFPQWTHENLALASFSPDGHKDRDTSGLVDARFRGIVPAVRASLNCTLYEQEDIVGLEYITVMNRPPSVQPGTTFIRANRLGRSNACTGNSSKTEYLTHNGPLGGDFHWSAFLNNTGDGCPPLNFYWGYQGASPTVDWDSTSNITSNVTYVKGLACYETTEQLDIDVTFIYPDLEIDTASPPIPLENTSRLFTTAVTTLPYSTMPPPDGLKEFYGELWYAARLRYGLADEDFGNPEQDEKIIAAIESAHGIVRAQQYHGSLRTNDLAESATGISASAAGIITDLGRYRLVMNNISTGVLCGLLGVILICTGISSCLMSTRYVLPKNPFSIGAMISLLADSNLLDKYLLAADVQATGRPNSASSILNSGIFRMGWFTPSNGGEKVFTVYVEESRMYSQEEDRTNLSVPLRSAPVLQVQ